MLRVGGGTTQSTKKSRVISKRNRHEMQFARRGKNCVAASRFRLSHSPEKIHPNDSNIFANFFRGIFEIFFRDAHYHARRAGNAASSARMQEIIHV